MENFVTAFHATEARRRAITSELQQIGATRARSLETLPGKPDTASVAARLGCRPLELSPYHFEPSVAANGTVSWKVHFRYVLRGKLGRNSHSVWMYDRGHTLTDAQVQALRREFPAEPLSTDSAIVSLLVRLGETGLIDALAHQGESTLIAHT